MMGIEAGDLTAMKHILVFYGRYVRLVGASEEAAAWKVDQVQLVLLKVEQILRRSVVVLSWEDLLLIKEAITCFVEQVREKIPDSEARQGVLTSCEQLRDYLSLVLPAGRPPGRMRA
jgi:hypothetical protein